MVQECKSLGITPLTEQQFAEEDRRIYTGLMRRRNGLSAAGAPLVQAGPPFNFGVYGSLT
jgi:hypothetical protein